MGFTLAGLGCSGFLSSWLLPKFLNFQAREAPLRGASLAVDADGCFLDEVAPLRVLSISRLGGEGGASIGDDADERGWRSGRELTGVYTVEDDEVDR